VLGGDVVSNHSTPDIGSRCPLDTEAPLASVSTAPLIYHAWHRFSAYSIAFGGRLKYLCSVLSLSAPDAAQPTRVAQFRFAVPKPGGYLITTTNGLDVTPESGSSTRSR
jgi:hypothetical protein